MKGGIKMIKVQVLQDFYLKKFNELTNIERANSNKKETGRLYLNDIFCCEKDIAKYLLGGNNEKKNFVKILEIIPEKNKTKGGCKKK